MPTELEQAMAEAAAREARVREGQSAALQGRNDPFANLAGSKQYHDANRPRPSRGTAAEAAQEAQAARVARAQQAAQRLPPAAERGPVVPQQAHVLAQMGQGAAGSVADIAGQLDRKVVSSRRNPMHAPTRQYIERTGAASQWEADAAVGEIAAEQLKQAAIAEQVETNVTAEAARIEESQRKEQVRQAKREEIQGAQRKIMAELDAADQMLAEVPDVDPDRFWSQQSTGSAIMIGIGAALMSIGGGDAGESIGRVIQRDIEAQKTAQKSAFDKYNARVSTLGSKQNLYTQMLDRLGDPLAAELATERSMLGHADRQLVATAQRAGLPALNASGQKLAAQLEARKAEIDLQLAQMAAANPERFTTVRNAITGERRKMLQDEMDLQNKLRFETGKEQIGLVGEAGRADAKAGADDGKDLQRRIEAYGERVEKVEGPLSAMETYRDIVAKEGVPTFEFGRDTPATAAREAAVAGLTSKMFGAATPAQVDYVRDMLSSMSQDRLLQVLDSHIGPMKAEHAAARAQYGDDAAARYRAVQEGALGTRKARAMPDANDPVQVDQ